MEQTFFQCQPTCVYGASRRKIRLKAMQNVVIQKIDLKRDSVAGVYLSEAQNPIHPLTHCISVYNILIYMGKGGRGEG